MLIGAWAVCMGTIMCCIPLTWEVYTVPSTLHLLLWQAVDNVMVYTHYILHLQCWYSIACKLNDKFANIARLHWLSMTTRICAEVARLELSPWIQGHGGGHRSLVQFGLHSAKSYVKSFRRVQNHANFIACLNVARPSSSYEYLPLTNLFTYKPVSSLRWWCTWNFPFIYRPALVTVHN